MARRGRPPKTNVARYASGAIKKPTAAQRRAAAAARQAAELSRATAGRDEPETPWATAAMQPHRRGDLTPLAGSALGRFVRQHRLRSEYLLAGERYEALVRKIWAADGVPSDVRVAGSGFRLGPTERLVRRWKAERAEVDRRLAEARTAVLDVAVLGYDVPPAQAATVINGLVRLAAAFGLARPQAHPFL